MRTLEDSPFQFGSPGTLKPRASGGMSVMSRADDSDTVRGPVAGGQPRSKTRTHARGRWYGAHATGWLQSG